MLPAEHRLRRSGDFTDTVRRGRRAGRPRLVGHLLDTGSARVPLVGFVVSKAVGGSVVRNRVERRLRHLVRTRLGALAPGTQLVVRASPAAATATWDALGADLDAVLARLVRRLPRGAG